MRKAVLFLMIMAVFSLLAGERTIATFSIVAYDPLMDEWGVAVQSKFFAVGAVVPEAEAGKGAIASQAWGNTIYRQKAMDLFEEGIDAEDALNQLLESDSNYQYRQVGLIDFEGNPAAFTGENCSRWAGHRTGKHYAVQGNILAGPAVIDSMANAFENTDGTLAGKLLRALEAGQNAGGDKRGRQSAALLVVSENGGYSGFDDRMIDIRVDDHIRPIEELKRLYDIHKETFLGSAYIRIGINALKSNNHRKADEAIARALNIAEHGGNNAMLYNSIAWEFAINDYRLEDALVYAQKAIDMEPEDGNIWDTLGEIYAGMGNYEKAVQSEERAIKFAPDNPLFKEKLRQWQEELQY